MLRVSLGFFFPLRWSLFHQIAPLAVLHTQGDPIALNYPCEKFKGTVWAHLFNLSRRTNVPTTGLRMSSIYFTSLISFSCSAPQGTLPSSFPPLMLKKATKAFALNRQDWWFLGAQAKVLLGWRDVRENGEGKGNMECSHHKPPPPAYHKWAHFFSFPPLLFPSLNISRVVTEVEIILCANYSAGNIFQGNKRNLLDGSS